MRRRALRAALPLPLIAACATQPGPVPVRVVFFADDSIALDEAAMAVVQNAATAARAGTGVVRVRGFSAPDPGLAPTVALSRARAERVAAELQRLGVPQNRIVVEGRGAERFESAPVESRRVEIRV